MCPQTAIVFPKYAAGGPIAGDEVPDEAPAAEPLKVDLASALKGDVYAVLRARGKTGCTSATKGPDAPTGEAVILSPRLRGLLDIPPEVIDDLARGGGSPAEGKGDG